MSLLCRARQACSHSRWLQLPSEGQLLGHLRLILPRVAVRLALPRLDGGLPKQAVLPVRCSMIWVSAPEAVLLLLKFPLAISGGRLGLRI